MSDSARAERRWLDPPDDEWHFDACVSQPDGSFCICDELRKAAADDHAEETMKRMMGREDD